MYRILIIYAFLLLPFIPLRSQSFAELDAETYHLYTEKKWKDLIRSGKSVLKQDIDYYYLRMRIGIAYYEQKNYKPAQKHFRRALEFNQGDPVASEYLYYAFLFAGQTQQAALLYRDFPETLKNKLTPPGLKIVDRISAEYLYNHFFTNELVNDPGIFDGAPPGAQIVTRDLQNLNLLLHHYMHPGTSFRHAYTYLGKENSYHYDDGFSRFSVDRQKVRQHQYYISPSFSFAGGLTISPSFHFLHIEFEMPYPSGGGAGPGGNNSIAIRNEFANDLTAGLSLSKFQGRFSYRAGAIYSTLNEASQFTGSVGLTWYPAGNLDAYMGVSLNAHYRDLSEGSPVLIPDFLAAYGIASRVWIELSGSYGEMRNYTESNAYLVYNGLDWMKYKILANLVIPLTQKGSMIYVGIRYAGYKSQLIPFYDLEGTQNLNILTYNSLSIFGGLSWKF
jgi:hypothetical protein